MIKIATIYLHDTGLYTTSSSSAVTGSGNLANNGDEIPLKIRTLRFSVGLNFDNSPQPGAANNDVFSRPKLAMSSIVSPLITLTGQINKDGDVSASANVIHKIHGGTTPTLTDESGSSFTDEVKMLGLLEHATRTKGYKELYYKATSADNLFYGLATDTESGGTYKCFYVRVKALDINETPDSDLIVWSCTLEITK